VATKDLDEHRHLPVAQIHPDRLAAIGALFGLNPGNPAHCRVLEIGCGSGGSLVPLADLYPASTFVGIDRSRTAVNQGRRRIDALELRNLRIDCTGPDDFPARTQAFDFIIVRGHLSRMPSPERDSILSICRRHLAPQGIACIQYDVYPGCRIPQAWREILLFHTANFDDPQDKIGQARSISRLIACGTRRDDAYHRLAREEDARVESLDDTLLQEDLAPAWQPFLFHEFVAMAEQHGLAFLADADYADMQCDRVPGRAGKLLHNLQTTDRIGYAQYLDFFTMRRTRRTLLCHRKPATRTSPDLAAMARFHYAAPLRRSMHGVEDPADGTETWSNESSGTTTTTSDPVKLSALATISAAWPATIPFDDLASETARETLCRVLHDCFASGIVGVHAAPRTACVSAGMSTHAWRVARLEAMLGSPIPNIHLETVDVASEPLRRLLAKLDGSRPLAETEHEFGGRAEFASALACLAQKALLLP